MAYSITDHVIEGREELNFSEWDTAQGNRLPTCETDDDTVRAILTILSLEPATAYANGDEEEEEQHEEEEGEAEEMIEEIVEGSMPLRDYLSMHPEARLTPDEQQQLINGIRATFQ
jgi:hypothetical protein